MNKIIMFVFFNLITFLCFADDNIDAINTLKQTINMLENNKFTSEEQNKIEELVEKLKNDIQQISLTSEENNKYIIDSLPDNDLPKPIEIEIEKAKSVEESDKHGFYLSPFSKDKENCIYLHIAEINDKFQIPQEDRINFKDVYKKITTQKFNCEKSITEEQLFQIMAYIEKHIMNIVFNEPQLLMSSKYVGLAKSMDHRFQHHKYDLKKELKIIQSRKAKCHNQTLKDASIRMSYLINFIPSKYHKFFESLVATIFPVQLFHASASIGDKNSWNIIMKYKESDERKQYVTDADIDKLKSLVDEIAENINNINLNETRKPRGKEPPRKVRKINLL